MPATPPLPPPQLDDYNMVSFVPLDATDEDSVGYALGMVDQAIQYGEDMEPKGEQRWRQAAATWAHLTGTPPPPLTQSHEMRWTRMRCRRPVNPSLVWAAGRWRREAWADAAMRNAYDPTHHNTLQSQGGDDITPFHFCFALRGVCTVQVAWQARRPQRQAQPPPRSRLQLSRFPPSMVRSACRQSG